MHYRSYWRFIYIPLCVCSTWSIETRLWPETRNKYWLHCAPHHTTTHTARDTQDLGVYIEPRFYVQFKSFHVRSTRSEEDWTRPSEECGDLVWIVALLTFTLYAERITCNVSYPLALSANHRFIPRSPCDIIQTPDVSWLLTSMSNICYSTMTSLQVQLHSGFKWNGVKWC